jgi:beta-lactamase class A
MHKICIALFLNLLLTVSALGQPTKDKPDAVLQKKLEDLTRNFKGDVGIYVRHLKTGKTAALKADTLFPTASMIKVPIMIGIFDKINRGELEYQASLTFTDSIRSFYPGDDEGLTAQLQDSAKVPLSKLVMLMITISDNVASHWCQQLAGTGTAINSWLAANGFPNTRVNSKTPGRETDRKKYGWGQTTPREMAGLLAAIREGKAVSPSASERMYRNLTRIYWDGEALSQVPPQVQVASKQGAVNQSRSEVVLVNAPGGDYVFCVITKNQQDQSWEHSNAGYVLLRDVSHTLWNHFEPKSGWKPAQGAEKWQ